MLNANQRAYTMKPIQYVLIALAALFTISCNKEKVAINDSNEATKDAIDNRKDQVEADAKKAIEQTDANAEIDKARIEAAKDSIQAQLDADKRKADAEAAADKAEVDANDK